MKKSKNDILIESVFFILGSGIESPIFKEAINVASKYKVFLRAGTPNKAAGNCLYESIIDNIKSRECFTEDLDDTPENYRKYWLREGELKIKQQEVYYPYIYFEKKWENARTTLQETNQY